jgi:Flp pilus assembly protein TadB
LGVAALSTLGVFLLTQLFLEELSDLVRVLHRRLQPRRRRLLNQLLHPAQAQEASQETSSFRPSMKPAVVIFAIAGLVGAVLARDILISPYLIVLGLGATWANLKQVEAQTSGRLADETGELVRAFRGIYAVSGSLYGSLEEAERVLPPEGDLRAAVKRVIARYGAGDDNPLRPLKSLPDPSLRRFVRVLALIGQSDTQAIREALQRLEKQISARKKLRNRVQVVLALMTGTLRILQGANLGAAAIAVTIPLWRDFFTATWGHRATFILATAGFALASAYFQTEKNALQEQAL